MEKWSTNIKPKVIAQSRGLTQTADLQDLIQNALATEVEEGNRNDSRKIIVKKYYQTNNPSQCVGGEWIKSTTPHYPFTFILVLLNVHVNKK